MSYPYMSSWGASTRNLGLSEGSVGCEGFANNAGIAGQR